MAHFSNFQDWGVAVDDRQEGVKCWWKIDMQMNLTCIKDSYINYVRIIINNA